MKKYRTFPLFLLVTIFFITSTVLPTRVTFAKHPSMRSGKSLLTNGDFSTDLEEGWLIHNQGDYEEWAGLADFSIENGELKVEVSQVGWEWWHIQLYQEPVEITASFF